MYTLNAIYIIVILSQFPRSKALSCYATLCYFYRTGEMCFNYKYIAVSLYLRQLFKLQYLYKLCKKYNMIYFKIVLNLRNTN